VITPAASPVTVTSVNIPPAAAGNPIFGQSLVFTATFAGPGNAVNGTTTFQDNGSNIAGCTGVVVTNNVASCTVNSLPVGLNNVTVSSLSGDSNHSLGAVTGTGNFTVAVDQTVTALVSSPNPSMPGQALTLTATVTVPAPGQGGAGSLNGTVTFTWGTSLPATNVLCNNVAPNTHASGATATCAVPINSAPFSASGAYIITATYSPAVGDTNGASSATITQTVTKPTPTFTSITSSVNPSTYGQTVTFLATFTVPGSTPPTGTVQFYDGPNTLGGLQAFTGTGPYTTSIGVPSGSIPILTAGNHTITATYVPGTSDNYGSVNSGTQSSPVLLSQQVTQGTVTATPSVSPLAEVYATQGIPNAPVYAEWITYTAVITPQAGTGIPTGYAVFKDAGTQFGPLEPLVTDPVTHLTTVSITTSRDTVGNLSTGPSGHPAITVSYLGDTNFLPTTSGPFVNLIISAAPTKTVLSAIPTTGQQYGTQLTLSATVCATQINGGVTNACIATPYPGFRGTMTFYDGGTVLNPGGTPVAVDSNTGIASITITLTKPPLQAVAGQAVGTHSITAIYNGDSNFEKVDSRAFHFMICQGIHVEH
jgi:hypothetical protein